MFLIFPSKFTADLIILDRCKDFTPSIVYMLRAVYVHVRGACAL